MTKSDLRGRKDTGGFANEKVVGSNPIARSTHRFPLLLAAAAAAAVVCGAQDDAASPPAWRVDPVLLGPGPPGSFDAVSVKDPTIVRHDGAWHLFYTARSDREYTTGYVSAQTLDGLRAAPRSELGRIRGRQSRYACAPQVFYFEPQRTWYLIAQTRDANYQPVYATTRTITDPVSWSDPRPLLPKDEKPKWIDFWVICDATNAFLFYTRSHRDVYVRAAPLDAFPGGWGEGRKVFDDVHEAVHIYKVAGRDEYHMIYELNRGGVRSFGLATAGRLPGPWTRVTDDYATGDRLRPADGAAPWTEMVSHGEALRAGCDQRLEYDPANAPWLIQGLLKRDAQGPYPGLPWRLGLIRPAGAKDDAFK